MSSSRRKAEIVTFKAEPELVEALRGVPNRSEFIREALLAALHGMCPVCRGTGTLTSHQRRHWEEFARSHALRECTDCQAVHLVCAQDDEPLPGEDERRAPSRAATPPAAAKRAKSASGKPAASAKRRSETRR